MTGHHDSKQERHDMTAQSDPAMEPMWGKVTALALANSPAHGIRLRDLPDFLRAFAEVKLAAAQANEDLGLVDAERAHAIAQAAREVIEGAWLEQFPLRVVATGGGTSTNMNVNEVLATRATQILQSSGTLTVHPNDHVNRSQSSNDAYPTAAKIMLARLAFTAVTELRHLATSFRRVADRHAGVERLGRTAWQDAVMVSVSATHEAHALAADRFAEQIAAAARNLLAVPLGGTVLGTGVGAPLGYKELAVSNLATITGLELLPSPHPTDAFTHADAYSTLADAAARCAAVLYKQASDLKILSSGPNGGLSEVAIPKLQPGSSIMPGKVNPVVLNMVGQASYSIRAAALAVSLAVSGGEPDFNGNSPAVVASLAPALTELSSIVPVLAEKCIDGLEWNRDKLAALASQPYDRLIEQAETVGYDAVANRSA